MNQVEVTKCDWSFTQGMVGYKRILEHQGINVETTPGGIIISSEHLKQLPEAFFNYFIDKYNVAERNERFLNFWHYQWKSGQKQSKNCLNKRLKDISTKVGKYFKEDPTGSAIINNINYFREQKTYHESLDEYLQQIIEGTHHKGINEKLTSNTFKAVYLAPYFGQPSFLNVSKNKLTVSEQKVLFYEDYIKPVLDEWKVLELINNDKAEEVRELIKNVNQKHPLGSLNTTFKKKDAAQMKQYILDEVFKCSFTDFPLGFFSLEESVFSPLALSLKNSLNSTWNSEGKIFFPISALAKVILFCAPAGATISDSKSIFVQFDGSFEEIYQANEHYHSEKKQDKPFDEVIFDLVSEQKLRASMIKRQYFIIEYESDYQAKKTILDSMVLTPGLVELFQNHSKLFGYLHYSIRIPFIKSLIKQVDTKNQIATVLIEKIKQNYDALEVLWMTIIRHYNQFYMMKGENHMDPKKQQDYIWVLYKSAESMSNRMGLKKAQGIGYRLLNAVRAGNKHMFMDTVMRVYISHEEQMPSLLLEALHENRMDFETVANAWIAGLISKPQEGVSANDK